MFLVFFRSSLLHYLSLNTFPESIFKGQKGTFFYNKIVMENVKQIMTMKHIYVSKSTFFLPNV